MKTATIHERVCALMRDGKPRFALEITHAVKTTSGSIYPILARLETDETLHSLNDPKTGRRLYVWNDA